MRARSLVTVSASIALLAAAVLRCAVPPLPPGPQAIPTRIGLATGAIVAIPPGATIDRPGLIASLKEMKLSDVILEASADPSGEFVAERVSLAVELQTALGGNVIVGGYQVAALNGQPMDTLLRTDPAFASCYPGGPMLDASAATIDKLRICSQAIGKKVADELARVGANTRIGCYVTHQPQFTDALNDSEQSKLHQFFIDASSACVGAKRVVGVTSILPAAPGNPGRAADLLRAVVDGTGIALVVLEDAIATTQSTAPHPASVFYDALRVTPWSEPIAIWASLEAFECAGDAGCDRTRPTSNLRFDDHVCGARARVDGIVAREYLHDLAGRPLLIGDLDASASASADAAPADAAPDDTDAAAQLRGGYLAWVDSGASCLAAAADLADAEAQAAPADGSSAAH